MQERNLIPSRILVVDDDPADREYVRRLLSDAEDLGPVVIREAATAKEGLATYADFNPTVILLDYRLPDMDGIAFINEIEMDCRMARVAVIMLTGAGDEQRAVSAMKKGATDYLSKDRLDGGGLARAVEGSIKALDLLREVHRRRDQIAESEQRFRSLADSLPMLVWMSEENGLVTYFNDPWLDFTGRMLQEEIGDGWTQGLHPDDKERRIGVYMSALETQSPFTIAYRLRRYDDTYQTVFDSAAPMYDRRGEFTGFVGSCFVLEDFLALDVVREHAAALTPQGS